MVGGRSFWVGACGGGCDELWEVVVVVGVGGCWWVLGGCGWWWVAVDSSGLRCWVVAVVRCLVVVGGGTGEHSHMAHINTYRNMKFHMSTHTISKIPTIEYRNEHVS